MASKKKASKKVVRKMRVEYHVPRPDHVGQVAKFVPAAIPTFEDGLAFLSKYFTTADEGNCRKFWDVLSALRGPDSICRNLSTIGPLKSATTAVIRDTVVGSSRYLNRIVDLSSDSELHVSVRQQKFPEEWHFLSHAKQAFEALGLKWDELN